MNKTANQTEVYWRAGAARVVSNPVRSYEIEDYNPFDNQLFILRDHPAGISPLARMCLRVI